MKNFLLYRAVKNIVFAVAFLIAAFSFSNLPAQTVVTVPSNNDVDFDNAPFDIADANYVGSGDIYQSTEIAVSGTITAIEWDNFSCPVITLPSVKIYMKLIPTTTTTWATETYATALTGATLVYSGSYTSSANNWANQVTLTTAFNYTTGNNLEIITESDYGSTNQNEPTWYSTTTVANSDCSWFSNNQAGLQGVSNSSGGIDQYRPAVRLTIIPCTGKPTITLGDNPSVCSSVNAQTAILPYSATTNNPTTYSISGWSGGGFATVSNATLAANSISIAVPAATAQGVYTANLTVTNGCDSTSANYSISVTVNQSPTATASYNSPVCAGQPLTLTGGPAGFTSYSWSGPLAYATSIQSPTVNTSATNTMAGTYTITVTSSSNCTATASLSVTVNTAPAMPASISGPASVCPLATNTYSVTAVTGATSYSWSLPNGWSGTSTTNSITARQGTGGGTISVTANNTCGNSLAQTLNVTAASSPATPGIISGPDSVCPSSTNTFSIAPVTGATLYAWTLPTGWSGTSTTNSISATEGTGPGTISVTADNTCGNSTAQTLAVTLASPPGSIGSITGIDSGCATSQNTYSVVAVSGATSYTWTLPGGWSGTSTTNSIQATLGTTGGNVLVTANNGCGSTAAQTLAVHVIAVPAMPSAITGLNSVCNTSTNMYSVSPVADAGSYTWTLPNSWSGSSTTNSISATAGSTGGNISVTANGTCGNSSAQTLAVTISSTPATPGSISQAGLACGTGPDTFSVASVTGATTYNWTLPNTWSGSSTTNSIVSTVGTAGGTVSVTAQNTCGTSTAQTLAVSLASGPPMPGTISQSGNVCAGGIDTFSVAAVNGATSYTWMLPSGWTGSSTTLSINGIAGSSGGTVTVTANNTCGSSTAQTLAVNLASAPATPGTISQSANVCANGNDTFSVAAVTGATSYTWTLPTGWSGSSTTLSLNGVAGSTGGTVSVTANNTCGSSTAQTTTVSLTSAPATPGTISQSGNTCAGSTDTLSVAAVTGATSYTWTLPSGWSGSSDTLSIDAMASGTGGTVSVTANNACGSSTAQTTTVSSGAVPATPGTISGADSVCAGSSANQYGIFSVNGASSYTWTLPSGWSGSSTIQTITANAGTTGGTISVKANNSCGSSAAQIFNVVVKPAPQVAFTFPRSPVCNNENPTVALNSGTPAGGNYSGQGVTGSTFDASALIVGTYPIVYSVTNSFGCTGSDTSTVAVDICEGIANMVAEQISVYPNPFNDAIIINTKGNYGNGSAILTEVTGREITRTEFEAGAMSVQINTPSLAKGAYLLQIIVEGKLVAAKKLVRVE